MALFSMVMMWLLGLGLWTPLNLIANTFWRGAPLGGRFSLPAAIAGAGIHLTMAILVGIVIAGAATRFPAARSLVIAGGVVLATVLWPVMQFGVWRTVDASAALDFTPWVFAMAHVLFGMLAATFAALWIDDADPRTGLPAQPEHRDRQATGDPA